MNENSIFTDLASFAANHQADELACKNQLFTPREAYVKQKTAALLESLESEYKKFLTKMSSIRKILREELLLLPKVEQESHAKELLIAINRLSKDPKPEEVMQYPSWQKFLGLSTDFLYLVYQIGCKAMDQTSYEKAESVFSFLTILNPLVAEHWMRLGFAFAATGKEEEALMAFSQASTLDANAPIPRLESAQIHIKRKEYDKATIELDAVEPIMQPHLQPQYEQLRTQTKNGGG